jgi:subtilase family serine protease
MFIMKKSVFLNVFIILLGFTMYVTPSAFSQPDLVVTSITHTPRYPTTNDQVTFTVIILNQGNQQAGACTLDVTLTGPKTTTHTINAPILASGASWSTQFTQKLNPKGTYTVTATIDFTNIVTESNETNNVKIINVICTTPNKEDLVVEVLTWTPLNPVETDTITITAGVKNIGPSIADASTLQLQVGTETTPPTYAIPSLDPGVTYEIQRQVTLPPGACQITGTADVFDVINEANENNNVTVETITVAAIPKPDLIVSSLTHSPANPSITDTITITSIVQNTGNADSTTSTLAIDVTGDATPTTYTVPILAPTQTFQVQRLLSLTAGGAYQVTATADADDDNWESDENNNTTMDSFSVTGPDLEVSSLTHAPLNPTISDTITITAIVRNSGDEASISSTLEIDVAGEATPATYAIPSLNPSDTYQVQRQVSLTTPGVYQVKATADLDDDVTETNETNNETTDNIIVTAPDLTVSSLGHLPIDPTNIDTITITAIVENEGDAAAGASTLEIDVDGDALTYAVPSLNPSETHQVQRQLVLNTPGAYVVTATADMNHAVTESNENNNVTTDTIDVIEAADLIINTLTHAPSDPTIIDTITITVVVQNRGETTAGASILEIDVDGEAVPPTYAVPSLAPSQTHQVQRQVNLTTQGNYQVTATADLSGDVAESNENNNTATDNIQVTAPDLVVSSLTHSPVAPTNLDTITITALVENIGDATATTSTLEIDVDGNVLTYEIPVLGPSETHQIQRQISLSPGSYPVTVTADLFDDVTESNENNNITTDTIIVVEAPDLIVSSLTHSPADPTISDTITITAIVQNRGGKVAPASTLKIDVDGDVTTHAIPSLNPSQTHQIQRQVNLTTRGTYPVTVTADYEDDVTESNESNNIAQDSITVTGSDLIVSSLTHSPTNPTIIDTITITAEVENVGDATATTSTLEIDVDGNALTYEIPMLAPAQTHQIQRQMVLNTPGTYPVTATADLYDDVTESDETNNTETDSITVTAPDLVVSSLTHSPANPLITNTITITSIVRNNGNATAGASTLEINVDGNVTNHTIGALSPSQTQQVQRQINLTSTGVYAVTAAADVNAVVTESNESNNTNSDSITVTAPDLVVSSLTHAPADPTNIDTITITAIVENIGDSEATTSTLEIDVNGDVITYEIPVLAPAQSFQIERWVILAAGTYPVTATADINDDVTESNEENNTAEDSITVRNLPDLVVSGLSYLPDIAVINEDITLIAEVRNAGLVEATTSTLTILVGSELTPAEFEIPPLDAGTTCTVERHISFDAIGSYPVTATADADEEVQETIEENNDASILIDVYEWNVGTLRDYLLNRIEFTKFQKRLYDVNKDGKLDVGDLILLIIKSGIV